MEFSRPEYFDSFRCRASKCADSCCRAGWLIPVDDGTVDFYGSIGIDIGENTYFDDEGDRVFKLRENKSCAYFREDGLCDLYIKSDGRLCDICTKYPRFYEEYDGFDEAGLSVSCPTAADMILHREGNPYTDILHDTDDELLEALLKVRAKLIGLVYSEPDPDTVADRLCGYGLNMEDSLFECDFDAFERLEAEHRTVWNPGNIKDKKEYILENCEILSERWRELLSEDHSGSAGTTEERRNYLAYLIYRYMLKPINDERPLAACGFISILYMLSKNLCPDYSEAVKIISREIEHDDENIEIIKDLFI